MNPWEDARVRERQNTFGTIVTGVTSAGLSNGVRFLYRNLFPRLGRMTRFAAVGALGSVVNLLVLALLVHGLFDLPYVVAAVIAAEISILHNFVFQERFVFRDMRIGSDNWRGRLTQHLLFNNAETIVRLPVLVFLVESLHIWALLAQAFTLAGAFLVRFFFVIRVVYRPEAIKRVGRHRAHSPVKRKPA